MVSRGALRMSNAQHRRVWRDALLECGRGICQSLLLMPGKIYNNNNYNNSYNGYNNNNNNNNYNYYSNNNNNNSYNNNYNNSYNGYNNNNNYNNNKQSEWT